MDTGIVAIPNANQAEDNKVYQGFSTAEAKRRLAMYGANEIAPRAVRSALVEFLLHFTNPLVLILLVASAVSVFAGEATNAVIIAVIILLSVLLDFIQERRSNKAAAALRASVALHATVIRDGIAQTISANEIVPGDLVQLTVGDLVPADGRIVQAKDFFVDQAAFTGESFPVEKKSGDGVEKSSIVWLGTHVTSGEAQIVITSTGAATEFAHLAKSLVTAPPETEFERGTRQFSLFVMRVVIGLVFFVLLVNLAFHRPALESFLFAIALAVGLTPGLLPMIASVTLAHGATRLVKKQVIVKRLAAIEDLGSMDVLCTDKTGTLTEGVITLERHVDLTGREDEQTLFLALLNATHQTGLRSPLDDAILRHEHAALPLYDKVDEMPFDFERRRLSVVVHNGGKTLLITKGAPEAVLAVCREYELSGERKPFDELAREQADATFTALSQDGYRALGVAYRDVTAEGRVHFTNADERDLVFVGFAGFLDPPRKSATPTLHALKRDAVEVKVLTGDNEIVTRKICDEVGLEVRGTITGEELEKVSATALPQLAQRLTIFARVPPDQKRRIISALQQSGHAVGYLGDGINDAPSLHEADVGLSVDTAVDVAREAADLILLRKSLHVIHAGIIEGRRTFGNVMKYILMGTSSNFGNMFSMAGASLLLPFLPMLPPQILLNNLLYDFSQITIPGDRVDVDYLLKPRKWSVVLIRRYMIWMGLVSSVFDFLTFGVLLWVFHASAPLFRTGWFIESLATQTLVILVIRTRNAPWRSTPSRSLLVSTLACVAVGALLPFTPLAGLLGFAQPPLTLLATIALMVMVYLALAELMKRWLYHGHFD
ncbi:MAG TPA: magnesium-translocating P-type ATPase [Blastocatellia bacterium]|nr:magnesium-translocating P-type ATPase [Blastocatellia bacterium]HNG30031.1 magnesium-translocating P-type ATPase [Blastocatellia bacterium]